MTFEQKTGIGLIYVLGLMSPASAPGRQRLKSLELYGSGRQTELQEELDNVERAASVLRQNPAAFETVLHTLMQIKDIGGTIKRLEAGAVLDELELFELKAFLALCNSLDADFKGLNSALGLTGLVFEDTSAALELLSLGQAGGFFISEEYSAFLAQIRRRKAEANSLLRKAVKAAADGGQNTKAEVEKYRQAHLAVSVEESDEEARVRAALCQKLSPFARAAAQNTQTAARLDLIIQKALLAVAHNACKPQIGTRLRFVNMFNPMVRQWLEQNGKAFTPVSLDTGSGATVITGANMGGKTVALKTLALNAVLALCGFFVFADEAEVPVADFVEIMSDNLSAETRGLSSFAGEIVRLNGIFDAALKQKGIILIDELAAGTNAGEGARIFRGAVAAFNELSSITVMSTHFDGAAEYAKAHYRVKGLKDVPPPALKGRNKGAEFIAAYMDYGLIEAPPDGGAPKEAIRICRMLGLSDKIMDKIKEN